MTKENSKRSHGQYFTRRNIFQHPAFFAWAERAQLRGTPILEPFAGENSLIEMLRELDLCSSFSAYDIQPRSPDVIKKDTLTDFPRGFGVVVTNPPYLAKNSATRRGIPFPDKRFDDLYKYALLQCLEHAPYVGAIIPASFLNAGLFRERLSVYIALPYGDMFSDTEHPVCLALFEPSAPALELYEKEEFLGLWSDFIPFLPQIESRRRIVFNHPQGNLALRAIDGTKEASIAFLPADAVPPEKVKHSCRNLVRLWVEGGADISALNTSLEQWRLRTKDVFLTPFKGLRADGRFRRRLDFTMAKKIILSALEKINN